MSFFGKKKFKVRFQIIISELSPIPQSLTISNPHSKIYPHAFSVMWHRGSKLKGNTKVNEVANGVVMFDNELFSLEGTITQEKSGFCKVKPMNFFINMHKHLPPNFKGNPEVKVIGETGFDLGDLYVKKEVIEVDLLIQKVNFVFSILVFLSVSFITVCKIENTGCSI
jgi:hypothetical protein